MKKLFAGLVAAGMLIGQTAAFAENNVGVFYNGKYINSEGVIQNNRTLIPLRAVCETLGSNVSWDGENQVVTVTGDGETVKFQIGNSNMITSSGNVSLDTSPVIIGDKTFVPLRALFELFDCNVQWNNGSVDIEKPEPDNNNGNNTEEKPVIPEVPENQENQGSLEKPETDNNVSSDNSLSMQVFKLVNEERAKHGLSALKYNSQLESVALSHSRDMAENGYFSHTSLSGLSPFDRMKNAGISYTRAAENIAAGQRTAASVMESWMNSEGHRANILNGDLQEIGIGVYEGGSYGIYWTQLFRTK